MKIAIYVLTLTMLVFGCSKEKRALKDADSSLKGVWELRLADGGMVPPITYDPGNGNMLKFDGSHFEKYDDGNLSVSGTYNVVTEDDPQNVVCMTLEDGKFKQKIVFDPASNVRDMLIEIYGEHMTVLTGCFANDGGARLDYVRRRE